MASVAQLVRASGCGSEGRAFESRHSPHSNIFQPIYLNNRDFVEKEAYKHYVNPTCFRDYDIRGIVGKTLFAQDAYYIGKSIASEVIRLSSIHKLCVGYDGRLSSPLLLKGLVEGIMSSGVDVTEIGICPTPMLYYATFASDIPNGIMVTGSHNQADYNGFKIVINKKPFFSSDIQRLRNRINNADYESLEKKAVKSTETKILEYYIKSLLSSVRITSKPIKAVWDLSNGSSAVAANSVIASLPGNHYIINGNIDGMFPGHDPDPTIPKNLRKLIELVIKERCDVGIAFDGDADRIIAVDDTGGIIYGDKLTYLYAKHMVQRSPGARVILDIKSSNAVFDAISKIGALPMIWKTGHSNIKSKMAETKALLGGEVSGHIFFADKYYGFDDGIYGALRLIELLGQSDLKLSEMLKGIPETLVSPEHRIECEDDRKFDVINEIKNRLDKMSISYNDIDGVRVNAEDGWWLIRASNTEPSLVLRYEANSPSALKIIQKQIKDQLIASNISISIAL